MFTTLNLPKTVQSKSKRIGRGGNRGKNSGHGNKGQIKRGGKMRIGFEGGQKSLIRRSPKIRGYNFNKSRNLQLAVLTLSAINKIYSDSEIVNIETLQEKKLIDKNIKKVKIIKTGKLDKKISFDEQNIMLTQGVKNSL